MEAGVVDGPVAVVEWAVGRGPLQCAAGAEELVAEAAVQVGLARVRDAENVKRDLCAGEKW